MLVKKGPSTNIFYHALAESFSIDAVIFEPSPTGPAGAVRVYGTEQQVEEFIRSDDFQEQLVRAQLLCHDIGIRRFMTGEALVQGFVKYAQLVNTL